MHSVQAAPRQRYLGATGKLVFFLMHSVQAAPRQRLTPSTQTLRRWRDALRAGSAEAKALPTGEDPDKVSMHSVQAAPRQSDYNKFMTELQ